MQTQHIIKKLELSPDKAARLLHLERVAALDPNVGGVQFIVRPDGIRQIIPSKEIMPARQTMVMLARKAVGNDRVRECLTNGQLFG